LANLNHFGKNFRDFWRETFFEILAIFLHFCSFFRRFILDKIIFSGGEIRRLETEAEQYAVNGVGGEDDRKKYEMAKKKLKEIEKEMEELNKEITENTNEIEKLNGEWEPKLKEEILKFSANFSKNMERIKCKGNGTGFKIIQQLHFKA